MSKARVVLNNRQTKNIVSRCSQIDVLGQCPSIQACNPPDMVVEHLSTSCICNAICTPALGALQTAQLLASCACMRSLAPQVRYTSSARLFLLWEGSCLHHVTDG